MTKQDYKNIVIYTSIVFIWIAILFFCLFKPYQNSMEKLAKQQQEAELTLTTVENYYREHGEKTAYQQKLEANMQTLQEKIPQEMAEVEFMRKLTEMAAFANVQITALNPQEVKQQAAVIDGQDEFYASKQWQLVVKGDYFAMLRFLQQLNAMARLATIKAGDIIAQNDELTLKLTLQIYLTQYN